MARLDLYQEIGIEFYNHYSVLCGNITRHTGKIGYYVALWDIRLTRYQLSHA